MSTTATETDIRAWMDRNLSAYLEQNPTLLNKNRLLGKIVPPGTIVDYGGTTAPDGWVLCDGSTYDATTSPDKYLDLWDAIGTSFGGTGQSSFKVPDTRGRVVAGYAASGGHTDVSTVGNTESGISLANRRPKHTHTSTGLTLSPSGVVPSSTHTHTNPATNTESGFTNVQAGTGSNVAPSGHTHTQGATGTPSATTTLSIAGRVGTSTDTADSPAYIILAQIIKL